MMLLLLLMEMVVLLDVVVVVVRGADTRCADVVVWQRRHQDSQTSKGRLSSA